MLKLFKEINGHFSIIDTSEDAFLKIEPNMWIHLVNPTLTDLRMISQKTNINYQMLASSLDEEETAHLDIDDDDTLIVVDIPYISNEGYVTIPFFIIYNKEYYVTICTKDSDIINLMIQRYKKIEPHKHIRLTLQILYRIAYSYITSLKKIDDQTKEVETILHNSMRNKEIFDLMNIKKSLVYFSTSLNSNKILLNKLNRIPDYNKYEDDFDLMEDVVIENNQAMEMCSIYRDILSGTMDTFASVISNNLNIVMKVLAIVTLVISIPTLIASLFGMNVDLPFQTSENGFIFIITISLVLSLIGGVALFRFTRGSKK